MAERARVDPEALDKLFEPYNRTDTPGFAVGVALEGRPAYRRGFGLASVELPVVLSPSIRMRIGSTTKHFCVLAVMLLAEEGKLSIDDSPRRHVPELPGWAETMTIRQCMAHTSGMRDSFDIYLHLAGPGRAEPPDTLLKMLTSLDSVDFEAGTNWSYNNAGYVLLTEIVERLSGHSFADFLYQRILMPVGMVDSMLRPLDTDLLPNSATLHVPSPDGGWIRGVFGMPVGGMGGMVSTVNDMLLWLKHMSQPVVGTPETWAAIRAPMTTHGYGLGLHMDEHRGLRTVHHAGTVVGGNSQMLKVLDHELDIIIMSNGRGVLELLGLVDAIIDCCIPGLPPPARDFGGTLANGSFHSRQTGRVLKLVDQEGRQALDMGSMTLPMRSDADGGFSVALAAAGTDMRLTPVREDGAVVAIELTEYGVPDRLERVEPPEATSVTLPDGLYESGSAGLRATITHEVGATIHLAGDHGAMDYAMAPIGPDLWEAKAMSVLPLTLTLEFDADGFRLTTGRTKRLRFKRAP